MTNRQKCLEILDDLNARDFVDCRITPYEIVVEMLSAWENIIGEEVPDQEG